MSASLVGSEMCIRDSTDARTSPGVAPAANRARMRPGASSGVEPASTPVSYTHLTLPTICSV
eukprot:13952160-Alexandrium_andersonii.AAC.1